MSTAEPLVFAVETDAASGWLVASWDQPGSRGGITTQAQDLERLIVAIKEAVTCHFDVGDARLSAGFKLRFSNEPVLAAL